MRYLASGLATFALIGGLILFLTQKNVLDLGAALGRAPSESSSQEKSAGLDVDIPNQLPLPNPPAVVRAIYATNWSAGSAKKINSLVNYVKANNLNAIVIDIKDYTGLVGYDTQNPDVIKYGAREVRIHKINTLLKSLHDQGIYVIGRVTVFQDPALAKARPDLAVHSKASGGVWRDNKGLSWIDATSKEAWAYDVSIARDGLAHGFDEINFDYVRFPSDGNLLDMQFSETLGKTPKHTVIGQFFKYVRDNLGEARLSADLFGLSTVNHDDLGIGQVIEDAFQNFDYVAPMIYPSHYAIGFLGYKNPAEYPYEVVKYSVDHALARLHILQVSAETHPTSTVVASAKAAIPPPRAKLRPWIQDFNLGAVYDATKVRAQIQALHDAGDDDGYMIWNASNIYTPFNTGTAQ